MNHPKQNLHEFLDRSFARFRETPLNSVESACGRVLDRVRKETDRTPDEVALHPRTPRRFGRVVILVAATAAAALFAQQVVRRTSPPTPSVKEAVVITASRAPATAALMQQTAPEPPKPATAVPRPQTKFAAASIKTIAPEAMMPGAGLACHGTDGVQRVVLAVLPGLQDAVSAPLGRCVGSGIFLSTLIEVAYGIEPRQISGGPEWSRMAGIMMSITADGAATTSLAIHATREGFSWYKDESFRFEAVADDPSTATLAELRQMLQSVLSDRFKLRFHLEQKEVSGYALVVAERGPRMKPISGDYVESLLVYQGRSTMPKLARSLGTMLFGGGPPIVDKTGLTGAYEYQLERPFGNPQAGRAEGGRGGPPPMAERIASLSAALEEQLGLRLQPEKAMTVDALTIDSVEPPSPN